MQRRTVRSLAVCGALALTAALVWLDVSCAQRGIGDGKSTAARNETPVTPALDPGGFTVDLSNEGMVWTAGDEVLRNGGMEELDGKGSPAAWTAESYVWLYTPDPDLQSRLHERIKPLLRWWPSGETPHGGRRSLSLAIPRGAHGTTDPPHEYCAYWNQSVSLADSAVPSKYLLTYHHRGRFVADVPNTSGNNGFVRVSFYDSEAPGQGRTVRVYAQELFTPSTEWRKGQMQFVVPAGTRRLDVWLAMRGCGSSCQVAAQRGLAERRAWG